MCHQCQRNDKGRVVRCKKCRTKRFCVHCIENWYAYICCILYISDYCVDYGLMVIWITFFLLVLGDVYITQSALLILSMVKLYAF